MLYRMLHTVCIFKHCKHRRLEDCFNDIPDSDPDSDDVDHPLEKAGYLSEREINQILAVKIKKLKELYKAELNVVNNDLIRYVIYKNYSLLVAEVGQSTTRLYFREERNDEKNIQFHFLKQSLVGNELLVAQMAKTKQKEIHFKQKESVLLRFVPIPYAAYDMPSIVQFIKIMCSTIEYVSEPSSRKTKDLFHFKNVNQIMIVGNMPCMN